MLKQPVGQKRLTNVALIKYKVSKKNFEIACYKNKAINWRNGIEKDLNEVLQSYAIYRKADLGEQASKEELDKYFPNMEFDEIIKMILDKGELDVGDKERDQQKDLMFKDIANLIAEKCVHPESKRPFSVDSIKAALNMIHFAPKLDQPPKKQASDCVKMLINRFYMARAEMKIKLTFPPKLKDKILSELEEMKVQPQSVADEKDYVAITCLIPPSLYRALDELLKKKLGEGTMEILIRSVVNRETTDLESAGGANLKLREKPLDEEEKGSDSEEEDHGKKGNKKNKKGKKKEENKAQESHHEDENKNKGKKENQPKSKEEEHKQEVAEKKPAAKETESKGGAEKKFKCSSCKEASFDTNQEFRTHFKTDWHNFNLKRKIEKKEPMTEDEFLDQLLDEDLTQKR